MKHCISILVLLILFTVNGHSQNLRLRNLLSGHETVNSTKGVILDSADIPVPDVLICLKSVGASKTDTVISDIDGEFPLPDGKYGDTIRFFNKGRIIGTIELELSTSKFYLNEYAVTIYFKRHSFSAWGGTLGIGLFSHDNASKNSYDYDDEKRSRKISSFPLPPPKGYSQWVIDKGFAKCKTQGDVYETLKNAAIHAGFNEISFFHLRRGFAMVLQIEQISDDGTPDGENRFSGNYYNNLRFVDFFIPRRGFFREIALVVTDIPLSFSTGSAPTSARSFITNYKAASFLSNGSAFLTKLDDKYTSDFKCIAIVYEFRAEKPNTHIFQTSEFCRISALEHLQKSKILDFLTN